MVIISIGEFDLVVGDYIICDLSNTNSSTYDNAIGDKDFDSVPSFFVGVSSAFGYAKLR